MTSTARLHRFSALTFCAVVIIISTGASDPAMDDPCSSVLNVLGKVKTTDGDPLDSVKVVVDQEGAVIDSMQADGRGRFAMTLDIGGFYGIRLTRKGFIVKRFVIDARCEDPAKVITGPFTAEVELRPEEDLANVDIAELELPYALIKYSPKDKAFVADEAYIIEMKKVEAALMLSSARAKKRAAQ